MVKMIPSRCVYESNIRCSYFPTTLNVNLACPQEHLFRACKA